MYRRSAIIILAIQRLFDPLASGLIFFFISSYSAAPAPLHDRTQFALFLAILTAAVFFGSELYASWRMRSILGELRQVLTRSLAVVFSVLTLVYGARWFSQFTTSDVIKWAFAMPLVLMFTRVVIRTVLMYARRTVRQKLHAVIVGSGAQGEVLADLMLRTPEFGISILGHFDDDTLDQGTNSQRLGGIPDAIGYMRAHVVDYCFICIPRHEQQIVQHFADALADTPIKIFYVPDVQFSSLLHAKLHNVNGLALFELHAMACSGVNTLLKRAEDLVLSSLILCLIAPLLAVIAFAIRWTSPGPILFRQRRHGLDGRIIEILKFRTMTVCEDGGDIQQAQRVDPRITPVGRLLRRTSLDELPQFINVLRGDMSIVGPRPHAVAHNEQYRQQIPGYMLRHKVKPGITGWAQINGWRGETDTLYKMQMRVQYDLEYIAQWSLWLDTKIIFLTLLRGFTGLNAY